MSHPSKSSVMKSHQAGVTLVVGLIFLLVLSLLAVSAVRLSTVNLRVSGNVQAQTEATAAAQQAIEQVMSTAANFYEPLTAKTVNVDVNNDGTTDYSVAVAAPVCLMLVPVAGYSANFSGFAPQDGYWDVLAVATNTQTGAVVQIHQGVKSRVLASAGCP